MRDLGIAEMDAGEFQKLLAEARDVARRNAKSGDRNANWHQLSVILAEATRVLRSRAGD